MLVSTNDIQLEVHISGPETGPAVFLLHGFPDAWFGWEPQIAALGKAGYRVIVPNQRGYGKSSKPPHKRDYLPTTLVDDIIELADELGIESFNLAGHDFGGMVAWNLATLYPDRVKKLVILNVPHPMAFGKYLREHKSQRKKSWYMQFFQLPWLPEKLVSMSRFAGLKRNMPRMDKELLRRYEAQWAEPGAIHAMINWYRGMVAGVKKKSIRYEPIHLPTRIIWGKQDAFLEPGLAKASLAFCPEAEIVMLDASHWVMTDQTAEVSRLLMEFFRDNRSKPPTPGPHKG